MKILTRLIKILYILLKYDIFSIINNNSIVSKILKKFFNTKYNINKGQRLKLTLECLGPIFIKLGQILSTRTDLIPFDIINELKKLQTNTKPIYFSKIKNIIEKSLNDKFENIFSTLNKNPIASASIAQLYTGKLKTGEKIIIKILKPNVENIINTDIKILKIIAKIITPLNGNIKRFKFLDIIAEIENTLENEMNFKNEAANLSKIKKIMNKNKYVYVPQIYWKFLKHNILIIEYLDGINITNIKKFNLLQFNTLDISKILLNSFYTQVFKHRFFHADLHPGNILISKDNFKNPIIILIDFGIMSNLKEEEIIYLAENILAFTKKDYKKIVKLHLNARTIITNDPVYKIENELCCVFEPILNKKIKDIPFDKTIKSIMSLTEKYKMQLQPRLVLFQKTLLTIESLCRYISPDINIWKNTRISIEKNLFKDILYSKFKKNLMNVIYNKEHINTYQDNLYKNYKTIFEKIFSKKLLYFALGYIIVLSMLISFLKYNQSMIFLL